MDHQKHRVADRGRKISCKTRTSLERWHCGATGKGRDKDCKRQIKYEDSGGRLPPVEGYSLQ